MIRRLRDVVERPLSEIARGCVLVIAARSLVLGVDEERIDISGVERIEVGPGIVLEFPDGKLEGLLVESVTIALGYREDAAVFLIEIPDAAPVVAQGRGRDPACGEYIVLCCCEALKQVDAIS